MHHIHTLLSHENAVMKERLVNLYRAHQKLYQVKDIQSFYEAFILKKEKEAQDLKQTCYLAETEKLKTFKKFSDTEEVLLE